MTSTAEKRAIGLNLLLSAFGSGSTAAIVGGLDWATVTSLEYYVKLAQLAERGGLDNILLADSPGFLTEPVRRTFAVFEPLTLLTALAARTERIGVIPSISTSFTEPYNVARYIASLELLAPGRAGWNIVTTSNGLAAANFGLKEQPEHDGRYKRAAEFVEVVLKLWSSWHVREEIRSGAPVTDLGEDITPIKHIGEHFAVHGALNVPPSQVRSRPLLSQAGTSMAGRGLGARYADTIYTNQQNIAQAREFVGDIRRLAREAGRRPDDITILPGIVTILGSTEREARAREETQRADLDVASYYPQAEKYFRIDLSMYDLSAPFPLEDLPRIEDVRGSQGTFMQMTRQIAEEHLTVEEAIRRFIVGQIHRTFVGTPEQLVDDFELWTSAGAADGFTLQPDLFPDGLEVIVNEVVPLLERRGLRHPSQRV